MSSNKEKRCSGWKWAFLILLLANVSVFIYIFSLISSSGDSSGLDQTQTEKTNITTSPDSGLIDAQITLGNKDLEYLLNHILKENNASGQIPTIEISDYFLILGELQVFGLSAGYRIETEPFAMENGDLQLKVSSIEWGSLNLPTKQILQLMTSQLDPQLPLQIDPEAKTITVALSEESTETLKRISLQKISKELAEYTFNITITKENLLQ